MLTSNRVYLTIISGFTGGVVLRSFFDFDFAFTIFLFFLSIIIALFCFIQQKTSVLFVSLVVFSVALGVLRFDVADLNNGSQLLEMMIGKNVKMEVVVIDEPDERENNLQLGVDIKNIFIGKKKIKVNSGAKIITDLYPKYEYGDRILLDGKLAKPKNFTNDETGKNLIMFHIFGRIIFFIKFFIRRWICWQKAREILLKKNYLHSNMHLLSVFLELFQSLRRHFWED